MKNYKYVYGKPLRRESIFSKARDKGTILPIAMAVFVAVFMALANALPSSATHAQGGSGGGGSTVAASPTTCTIINDFKTTAGYTPSSNSSLGAVWVQWKLNSCASPSGQGIDILVTLTDSSTNKVAFTVNGMLAEQLIDFDDVKTGTPYHVDFTITDRGTGAVMASRSADVVTPSHNRTGL